MTNAIDWQAISAKLREPFNPADVDFRPQGKPSGNGNVQVVAYVDSRTVMARLDEACGPGGWSFTYEPIVVASGQVQIAKGRLEIHGVVREDVGEASNFDPSKGCISDTLKRVAVQFGVGRYLYDIERTWVKANGDRLSDETIAHLRSKLPRPDGKTAPTSTPQPNLTARAKNAPASTPRESQPSQAHGTQVTPQDTPAPEMTRQQFLLAAAELGYSPRSAMEALAVRTLDGLNLAAALRKLQAASGKVTPEHDLSTLGNGGGRH